MPELTRNQRSTLAVGVLLAVIGLVFASVIHPAWRYYQDNENRIARHQGQLARFRQLASNIEAHKKKLALLEQKQTADRLTLQGESSTLAAASLQARVNQVTDNHGADLNSTRIQPVRQEGDFLRLTVKVSLRLTINILQQILYELENGTPLIIIDRILIQKAQPARRMGRPDNQTATLLVQMDLAGFVYQPEQQDNGNE